MRAASVPRTGGPPAGRHSSFRGGSLATYDTETRAAIAVLASEIDADADVRGVGNGALGTLDRPPGMG